MFLMMHITSPRENSMESLIKDLIEFKNKYNFIKRIMILNEKASTSRCIVWVTENPDIVINLWKSKFNIPLRIIPNIPIENGITQKNYNLFWDRSSPVGKGIRFFNKNLEPVTA